MRKTYPSIIIAIVSLLFIANSAMGVAEAIRMKIEVKGYWRFEFKDTVGTVERTGDTSISELIRGESYSFKMFDMFKSIEEIPSGKVSYVEQIMKPPKIKSTTLNFIGGQLWQILIEFDPTDYDAYKKIIVLDYGQPNGTEKLNLKSTLQRGDRWTDLGGGCIFLRQFKKGDGSIAGYLDIKLKAKCGG